MHRLYALTSLRSPTHVRLIRHHNERESGIFQSLAAFRHIFVQFEFRYRRGRKRAAVPNHRAVENAIAIKKDGALPYFVLSHLVCAVLSAG